MPNDNVSPNQMYLSLRSTLTKLTSDAETQRARQSVLAKELDELTKELEDTLALISIKEAQVARFAELFPEALDASAAPEVKVVAATPVPKTVRNKVKGELTFPEVIQEVLGDKTMNARQVLEALEASGYQHTTSNPEANTSTTLSSYSYAARDANDKIIRNEHGKGVKVKPFIRVGRGSYRNATEAEIQAQITEGLNQGEPAHLEVSPAVTEENPEPSLEAATEILASQGIHTN